VASILWLLKIIQISFQSKKCKVVGETRSPNEVHRLLAFVQPDFTNYAAFCI